ncbi:MAG: DUF58 domain-containing protein, partial [Candidatus Tectomicrobia bacterium]|nr:DUF58 domain-containing protein [Candidatus Tectomicrobia bacterium]
MIDTILRRVCFIPYRGHGLAQHQRLGRRRSHRRGEGLEFDQIKEHQAGEEIRRVNWSATARRGGSSLFMNSYYEDKSLTVMLLVDLSASMDFGSRRLTKKTLAAELCASLAYSAFTCHDRIGLLGFTSEVACYLPPRQAPHYQWSIPETILEYDSTRTHTDFWVAAQGLQQYLKHRALVFLLSDFLTDESDQLAQTLSWLRSKHDLINLRLSDPREMSLPPGRGRMLARDLETGKLILCRFSRRNRHRMAR